MTAAQLLAALQAPDLLQPMLAHAQECMPRECCGLVVETAQGLVYWPCKNSWDDEAAQDRFAIAPADQAAAEDAGTVLAVVHSHPNASAEPSEADRVQCTASGMPWLIIGWPSQVLRVIEPGYRADLIGRQFHHGVLDCYTLVQDHYRWLLQIDLPNFARPDDWWDKGQHLYTDNFAIAGFVAMPPGTPPHVHDVILMNINAAVPNHAAVLSRPGVLLHHLFGRLSCEDVYGGYWLRHTTHVLRHTTLVQAGPQ